MARELTIIYGSISMGGASESYLLDGKYTCDDQATVRTVSWRVTAVSDSEEGFQAVCVALEEQFRTRYASISIFFGGAQHVASGSTGFLEEPSASKLVEVATTGRSRVYECSVSFRLPASDNSDLIEGRVTIAEDESQILTITGTGQYTATSSDGSAYANAVSKAPGFVAGLRPAGTWDEGLLTVTTDDQDKIADFRYVQREIIYKQTAAGLNNTTIIRPRIGYTRSQPNPGDAPGSDARRRSTIRATYSCGVKESATTDLLTLYTETIRPYLLTEVERLFEPQGGLAIMSEDPGLDAEGNRIDAVLTFEAEIAESSVHAYTVVQDVQRIGGKILVPVWNADPYAKYVYQGPARVIRTTSITAEGVDETLVALAPIAIFDELTDEAGETDTEIPEDVDKHWAYLDDSVSIEPVLLGEPDSDYNLVIYRGRWEVREEFYNEVGGGRSTTRSEPVTHDNFGNPINA